MGVAYQIKTDGYVQDNLATQQFYYSTQQKLCIYWTELSQRRGWQTVHLDKNPKWGTLTNKDKPTHCSKAL